MGFNLTQIANKQLPVKPTSDSMFRADELVKVPFREGYYVPEGGTIQFQRGSYMSNEDGSNTLIYVSVAAGATTAARIRFPFYGRKLGIRWQRDNTACDFDVMIDGVAYNVHGQHDYLNLESAYLTDGECLVIVEDSLPDGLHYADIQVNQPTTGTNSIRFFGYLAERRAGYEPRPRVNGSANPYPVQTTSTVIAIGNYPQSFKAVRKILYTNTTASAITVTVTNNGTIMWSKSVPANDSLELDFGQNTAFGSSALYQYASATGVNYTVLGGY